MEMKKTIRQPLTMKVANHRQSTGTQLPLNRPSNQVNKSPVTKKLSQYKHLSPTTRKLNKEEDSIVIDATFKRLLAIRATNGGK
jgi:hypothetical protein